MSIIKFYTNTVSCDVIFLQRNCLYFAYCWYQHGDVKTSTDLMRSQNDTKLRENQNQTE